MVPIILPENNQTKPEKNRGQVRGYKEVNLAEESLLFVASQESFISGFMELLLFLFIIIVFRFSETHLTLLRFTDV